jgi:hypothetical protein
MLVDWLDWIDGWPTGRGGKWASQSTQQAPVTDGPVNDPFNRRISLDRHRVSEGGGWRLVKRSDGQGFARQQGESDRRALLVNRNAVPTTRVEGDLWLCADAGGRAVGIGVRHQDREKYAVAWLDRAENALVPTPSSRARARGGRVRCFLCPSPSASGTTLPSRAADRR